jgi:glycosyltransferase involved in cell wall biosynthesis
MMPGRHDWYLYSDVPIDTGLSSLPNVSIRSGRARPSSVAGLYYSQGLYRYWGRRDEVDLFWSPRHHLPLALDGRIPQVVTIHDLVWKRFPETMPWQAHTLERILMPAAVERADKIICVSDFTAAELGHYWPEYADKCVVIKSAATDFGSACEGDPVSFHPYILFVGTLEPRKNLRRLLRAFATLVHENRISENLVIAGARGWGTVNLESLVKELSLELRVSIMGHTNDSQLGQLYRGARCLVMPSLYEGFGLPVLEAMQFGVPAVVSDVGALPEICGNGGLLVDPNSVEDIARAIELLMIDDHEHAKLSREASERASKFSWRKAAGRLLSVFESLHIHEELD